MIIPKANVLSAEQLAEVQAIVAEFGCQIGVIKGAHRSIYAILGDERKELMLSRLEGLSYVDRIDRIDSPFKLMDLRSGLADHDFAIGGITLGKGLLYIAGPCTVDPKEAQLTIETAHAVKAAGAHALRGGVWKPRTMPYSYQGEDAALEVLLEARAQTKLPLNVEVMDERQLAVAVDAKVDVIQIGTRNGLNYTLLKKIGECTANTSTAVLLKRSRHMGPIDEFIAAAEYIVAAGNPKIMLCPRGTLPGLDGYRNHPDESITPLLKEKTWAPVVYDPSHAVGRAQYVEQAALAAVAYGADGLNLEAHISPKRGIGDDPKQALNPTQLARLFKNGLKIYEILKGSVDDG